MVTKGHHRHLLAYLPASRRRFKLSTEAERKEFTANSSKKFIMKQGAEFKFTIKFRVNQEIVHGLKFTNTVKTALKNDSDDIVLGSYAPGACLSTLPTALLVVVVVTVMIN